MQDTSEDAGARQRRTGARRRSRRAFGSVERLPSGQFRARVIGPDGRYVSAPTTFSNRTDAALWVDLQRADLARGTWQAPVKPSASPSVTAFVTSWIEEHPSARASTKELYRGLLRTCITPGLGTVAVSRLTPAAVRHWHHQLGERLAVDAESHRRAVEAKGRTTSTASVRDGRTRQAQAFRLLRAAMATAVTDGLLPSNPCTLRGAATPQRAVGRDRPVGERLLSPAQLAQAAAAMPDRYRVLVLMAAWSGLRQGELLALTRADLDLDAVPARVSVRKAVRRGDDGRVRLDVPKTPSSVRVVTLPGPLTVAVRDHLERFVPEQPSALVFATSSGSIPARSNLGASWRRACTSAGVPHVRLHDLRHVAQVLLIAAQRPDATRVAGYGTWRSLGRQVRKGEKGIAILAPCLSRTHEERDASLEASATPDEAVANTRELRGFRVVHVFDVTQTEGDPLPDVEPELLTGAAPDQLWDDLVRMVETDAFAVERGDCGGANGVTRFDSRTVRVRDDVEPAQAVKTLAHELGHIRAGHEERFLGTYGRSVACHGIAEVEAESIAYLVTTAAGLDCGAYSVPYVASWSGGDAALIRETASWVIEVAAVVHHDLFPDAGSSSISHAPPGRPVSAASHCGSMAYASTTRTRGLNPCFGPSVASI